MSLLLQSLVNSSPVIPNFLTEYEQELTITAARKYELERTPVKKDEISTGYSYFTDRIHASFVESAKVPDEKKKQTRNAWSAVLGWAVGVAGGAAALVFAAPVAVGALAAAGYGAAVGAGGVVTGLASAKISDSMSCDTIKSEHWLEASKKIKYTPPPGRTINAAPTYETTGQGRVKIHEFNDHGILYEITAVSGGYSVNFTSYERWVHKVDTGAFNYR